MACHNMPQAIKPAIAAVAGFHLHHAGGITALPAKGSVLAAPAPRGALIAMRIIAMLALAIAAVSASLSPVAAQTPSREKTQAAYELAMKCFVANGFAESIGLDDHDEQGAAYFKGKGKIAFDKAVNLGKQLGYPNERINGDFNAYRQRELPRMFKENGYFRSTAELCKAYGLM